MEKENLVKPNLPCFCHPRRLVITKKSVHRGIRHRNVNGNGAKYDICGLKGNYDVFSDDSEIYTECGATVSKFTKCSSEAMTKGIHHKTDLINNENIKIQVKIKNLYRNVIKKDKLIAELNAKNMKLKEQLQEIVKNNAHQDSNLMEFANTNSRLQKELDKKAMEITEMHSKLTKSEFTISNLIKDIEFYKTELNTTKKENLSQQQKFTNKSYETLQKKFYEIKIENSKLCRKFKEIRLAGDENSPKSPSYHVLFKKFETVQQDMIKLKMENKKLKDDIRKNKQVFDDEMNKVMANTTKSMCKDIEHLIETNKKMGEENQMYKLKIDEMQLEFNRVTSLLTSLQIELEKRANYSQLCENDLNNYKTICAVQENKIKTLSTEKDEILKQHLVNEENNNKLKLKLDELAHEKAQLLSQNALKSEQKISKNLCENCILLKQELEKLGYANLRLNKEKHNLQSNFQKLSIKTSKLTLKMEELELEKQKQVYQRHDEYGKDENLMQQNFLLSKRLHNLLKKSEKLFKAHVIEQQAKREKDEVIPAVSNDQIIEELNENLGSSKSNLEMIENKLNEEEWKLNAALKHIKSVKDQIKMEL